MSDRIRVYSMSGALLAMPQTFTEIARMVIDFLPEEFCVHGSEDCMFRSGFETVSFSGETTKADFVRWLDSYGF